MHEPNRHHRSRWFQLSLRSLFLVMLVVAAYFAGYRTAARHAEQAQQAERDARLEAERSAAEEAKRAEEQAQIAQYMQILAAQNALVQEKTSKALAEIEAALQLQEKGRGRERPPERIDPKEK